MKLYIRTLNPLVVSMYENGKSVQEIGEVFGVSQVAVYKALKKADVEMRPCGKVPGKQYPRAT